MWFLHKVCIVLLANGLIWGYIITEKAGASLVEVMQRDPAMTVGRVSISADLVSLDSWKAESARSVGIPGSVPISLGTGISAGNWKAEYREIGPIVAGLRFFGREMNPFENFKHEPAVAPGGLNPFGANRDTSVGGATPKVPAFGEISISGSTAPLFTGEIKGTTGQTVTVEFSGLLPGVSSVPLPGAVWLFASGLAGLALLRRRMRP